VIATLVSWARRPESNGVKARLTGNFLNSQYENYNTGVAIALDAHFRTKAPKLARAAKARKVAKARKQCQSQSTQLFRIRNENIGGLNVLVTDFTLLNIDVVFGNDTRLPTGGPQLPRGATGA
jgi:hypothetical protein